jgi:phosphatidate cytidylyltransferase
MLIAVCLVVLSPYWSGLITDSNETGLGLALLFGLCVAGVVQAIKFGNPGTLVNLAATCFSTIYLGVGCWFLVSIRLLGRSNDTVFGQVGYLLLFLACVKSADIGAYFTGRFIGRHKWVPSISPGKTWEGFFGGVVLATIVASLFAAFSAIIPRGAALWFGPVVAVTGQLGDLLESMLKRDAGSKDSARLIPEFGGILDLLDSVVVAAPFAWLILSKLSQAGP